MDFSDLGGKPVSPPKKAGKFDFSDLGAQPVSEAKPEPQVPGLFHQALGWAASEAPPIAGGMMGSAVGTPFGPIGKLIGSGLGGATGKAVQTLAEYGTGQRKPSNDTAMGNAIEIGKAGLTQAAAEAGGQSAAEAIRLATPGATKLGAAIYRVATGTPEKYGEALIKDAGAVAGAPSPKAMSKAYQDFENAHNLQGLGAQEVANEKVFSPDDHWQMLIKAGNKLARNEQLTDQELYSASQAGAALKRTAKYNGGEQWKMRSAQIDQAKDMVDSALGNIHEEYTPLRLNNFLSNAKEATSAILPQNKNLSPNVLRSVAALALGPGAVVASPKAWQFVIRGASAAAPAVSVAAGVGARAAMQGMTPESGPQAPISPQANTQPEATTKDAIAILRAQGGLNPKKSPGFAASISGINLPTAISSNSGKLGLNELTRIFHERGVISDEDPQLTLDVLKRLSAK